MSGEQVAADLGWSMSRVDFAMSDARRALGAVDYFPLKTFVTSDSPSTPLKTLAKGTELQAVKEAIRKGEITAFNFFGSPFISRSQVKEVYTVIQRVRGEKNKQATAKRNEQVTLPSQTHNPQRRSKLLPENLPTDINSQLSEQQEIALGKLIASGKAELEKDGFDQDPEILLAYNQARMALALGWYKAVTAEAYRLQTPVVSADELIRAGFDYLYTCTESFDFTKGRFSTYVFINIPKMMKRYLRQNKIALLASQNASDQIALLDRLEQDLYREKMEAPTVAALSQRSNLGISRIQTLKQVARGTISFDVPIAGTGSDTGDQRSLGDLYIDPNTQRPEQTVANQKLTLDLQKALSMITRKEREAVIGIVLLGKSSRDLVETSGKSFDTYNQAKNRGLARLKKILIRMGYNSEVLNDMLHD
jgi:RNA polymerase sigma factor (sigma-70 family)